jgi:hypothetical protein
MQFQNFPGFIWEGKGEKEVKKNSGGFAQPPGERNYGEEGKGKDEEGREWRAWERRKRTGREWEEWIWPPLHEFLSMPLILYYFTTYNHYKTNNKTCRFQAKYSIHTSIKLSASGGQSPLTRGSVPGPRLGLSPQAPCRPPPIIKSWLHH